MTEYQSQFDTEHLAAIEARLPGTREVLLSTGHVLHNAGLEGIAQQQVAAKTDVSPSTASKMMSLLHDEGLIERLPNRIVGPGQPLRPFIGNERLTEVLQGYNVHHAGELSIATDKNIGQVMDRARQTFATAREVDGESLEDLVIVTGLRPETIDHFAIVSLAGALDLRSILKAPLPKAVRSQRAYAEDL